MRPLATMRDEDARALDVLLFDLDDTLLTHGVLERAAYAALCDLADAGLGLVAVTGRPAGWGEVIARQWPLLGAITENGAVALRRVGKGIERSVREPGRLAENRVRLAQIVADVRGAFPEVELADDVDARRTDVTFDVGERRVLPRAQIDALRTFVEARGARSTVSSVHLHATFEGDDKATGTLRFLQEIRGLDPGAARVRAAFVGDSGNDAACFAAFRTTIGVANVRPWLARLTIPPVFVTDASMGAGFAELARHLVRARAGT